MYYYVNHQAIHEIMRPIEVETDPQVRLEIMANVRQDLEERLFDQYAKTCYELKLKGWSTGQIAELSGLSERKVKVLIRFHADSIGEHNPLGRHRATNVIDISHLVGKGSVGLASPPSPTLVQP
jgi:hypothetical protein